MTILDRVKSQLGISHTAKNEEINANIATARAELIRLGVSSDNANGNDALVEDAIVQFAMSRMAPANREMYQSAWDDLKDNIRRTSMYRDDNDV